MIVIKCDRCLKELSELESFEVMHSFEKKQLCNECYEKSKKIENELNEYYSKAEKVINDAMKQKKKELEEKYFSKEEEK